MASQLEYSECSVCKKNFDIQDLIFTQIYKRDKYNQIVTDEQLFLCRECNIKTKQKII